VIDALDAALATLLDRNDAPAEIRDADVSFETPDRSYRPTGPTVNLFLAVVQEDTELRLAEPQRRMVGGRIEIEPAPLRIECRYLLTTWTPSLGSPAATTAAEHRMLGSALAWLAQFPVLPPPAPSSPLADQPTPARLRLAVPAQTKDSDIWTSLGATVRPAAWVTATLALPPSGKPISAPTVTSVTVGVGRRDTKVPSAAETLHVVAGRLRRPDGSPLVGAVATLEPLGRRASSDAAGGFRFGGIPSGTYQLRAEAVDHEARTWTAKVPPEDDGTYDSELQPST
jgi:hypothetical protein